MVDDPDEPTTEEELLQLRHDQGATIALGLPSREECALIYKMLGPTRSYPKIAEYLKNQGRRAPASGTLKQWAVKDKWQFQANGYDRDVAARAAERAREEQTKEAAEIIKDLSGALRRTAARLINKVNSKIQGLKLADGTQIKAATEAALNLAKAAEVMDGGVSDRTATVAMTITERQAAAVAMVDNVMSQFGRSGVRNDNKSKQPMGNAADDGGSAGSIPRDPVVGRGAA